MEIHKNFIKKAKTVHQNRYDYSLIDQTNYNNIRSKLPIICSIHGVFYQRGDDHNRGHGCPKCISHTASNKALSWLDYIQTQQNIIIQHAGTVGEFNIPTTKLYADGYCVDTNTVYEFDGDAFHGNPNRYLATDKCHPYDKTITAQELHTKTIEKHTKIKQLGYNLVTIWESEFDQLGIMINQYINVNSSKIDNTYEQQLSKIGISLLESYKGAKITHLMKCDECGHEWKCTPLSKIQTNKKRGSTGCPYCNRKRSATKQRTSHNYEGRLLKLNYKVLDYINATIKVTLVCTKCGKSKHVTPSAIIRHNKPCCE